MSSKYYLAHNAGSRLVGGQQFEVTQIFGGTAIGVFEATTAAQQEVLDLAVKNPTEAVEEITQSQYDAELKKKVPSFSNFQRSNLTPKPQQTPLKETAGVVVEESPQEDLSEIHKMETVAGALGSVGVVAPPPQSEEPPKKPKK